MAGHYGRLPGGDIAFSTFVKLDPARNGYVLQAGVGDQPYGIAGPYTRRLELAGWTQTDGRIGTMGDPAILIYGPDDREVLLRLGTGVTVNPGDLLKPDASGNAVNGVGAGDWYGAKALLSGVAGDLIPVEVVFGKA